MHIHFKAEIFYPNRDVTQSSFNIDSYLSPRIKKQLVFGKSSKIMTSRIFQVIAKLLCNLLDISASHEYASILPK